MPAKSKKQERFMQAVANNPEFAKKAGVPQSVGKEFTMKKYQAGGMASSRRPKMRPEDMEEGRAPRRSMRPRRRPEDMEMDMSVDTAVGRGNRASMREAEEMPGMMMGGKVKKMAKGGKVRGAGMASKGVRACKMM